MSVQNIAKSLANELIKTKEYQKMTDKKKKLFSNVNLRESVMKYEEEQLQIMRTKTTSKEKQIKMNQLQKKYQSLLNRPEMIDYINAINIFQKKVMSLFNTLNEEINKIVNR